MTENALTPVQYAEHSLAFADTAEKLKALAASSVRITAITNRAGYQECHAARMALKTARVDIEKRGKAARADAFAIQKAIIAKESELVGLIEPEEKRLKELQDAVDQEEERKRAAEAEAERQRITALNARFDAIRALPRRAIGEPAETIRALLEEGYAIDVASFPSESQAAAQYEKTVAVGALNDALRARIAADEAAAAAAAKAEADRIELERLRAEAAEREAREQAARAAREAQEAAERAEREAREAAQRAELEAARKAQQEAEDRARREQQAREDAERAEAARKLQEQQEAARREAERLAREKAELAERERQQAIASATLHSAAGEALELLKAHGLGDHLVAQKLAAALGRESVAQAA